MQYEWDPAKEEKNIQSHDIDFESASEVFNDPYVYEEYDEKHSGINVYGEWEDRYFAIGMVHKILYVVYTIKEEGDQERKRLISARLANGIERQLYYEWCKSFLG